MKKVLLINNLFINKFKGGREKLTKLNQKVLLNLFNKELTILSIKDNKNTSIFKKIFGFIDGVNNYNIKTSFELIYKNKIDLVFIDGSNLGLIAKKIKKKFPKLKVIIFFHNIEVKFFFDQFLYKKNIHSLGILFANYIAEKSSFKHSDIRICMTQKDSKYLNKIYGLSKNIIIPMGLEDKNKEFISNKNFSKKNKKYLLFVGSFYYGNIEGIKKFIKNILPKINIKIYIIGKDMEKIKASLEIPDKSIVIGSVENLSKWYRESLCVISPLYSGSGMKTKIAEALMFGKRIIGTPISFEGYESNIDKIGWVCKNDQDYINNIREALDHIQNNFDTNARTIYENFYSYNAYYKKYYELFKKI